MESSKEIDIIITIVFGIMIMFLLSTVVIYSIIRYQKRVLKHKDELREVELKFQNELLDASISIAEFERKTISKNLHDEIGALLNVIKQNNTRLKKLDGESDESKEIIENNNKFLLEINENVRTISNELYSPTLNRLGFFSALELLIDQIVDSKVGNIEFFCSIDPKSRFQPKFEIQLYRVCKELINNILKHSHSNNILIKIEDMLDHLHLVIEYDGKGINDEDAKLIMAGDNKGLGLKSIYSRVQIMKGELHYLTPAGANSRIDIVMPFQKEDAEN